MKKKLIIMCTFNILMWVCLLSAIITLFFSHTAYQILICLCWLFAICNLIACGVVNRQINKERLRILDEWGEKVRQQLKELEQVNYTYSIDRMTWVKDIRTFTIYVNYETVNTNNEEIYQMVLRDNDINKMQLALFLQENPVWKVVEKEKQNEHKTPN